MPSIDEAAEEEFVNKFNPLSEHRWSLKEAGQ
jgi:hypothetical protein